MSPPIMGWGLAVLALLVALGWAIWELYQMSRETPQRPDLKARRQTRRQGGFRPLSEADTDSRDIVRDVARRKK